MRTLTFLLITVMSIASMGLTPAQQKQLDVKITIEGRPEHPTVYMTRADIERARTNREKHAWAKRAAERLLAEADSWANRSDQELLDLVPPEKSSYAYGFAGCPVCGGTFAGWWGMRGVAKLEDPRHVRCVNGHRLPDEEHPDAGDGWTAPDGRKFYFVGTYNSYIIDVLTGATTNLVHAYALTGDKKYAHKAALLLDNLARIYPTSEAGSADYPSDPPSGRFNRPWYQVARTLVLYANQYDILLMGDALDEPSSVAGMTRRKNIEQNMLLNGAAYCYRQSVIGPALHNGQADYIRGPMAVAAAMGIPQYIAWGVDGPYSIRAMIANNVDRDGQYYETSAGYSDHARSLYMDMAEIVRNYTDAAHPDGINLSADPVFRMFNLLPRTRLRCATLPPSLGDDAPNVFRLARMEGSDARDIANLERLCALANDPELDRVLAEACSGDVAKARYGSSIGSWLLFHARELPGATAPSEMKSPEAPQASDLFSQKGLAILRSGIDENARAATLRFGPTLNHGHFDEMNLNVYAHGYEMSYDLGYALGSTHTQVGWAKQTASHNLVVVDETSQLEAGRAGGTLKYFKTAPGVTVVSANNANCYSAQGVSTYERTVAMIDASDDQSYIVDIFRVRGGSKHDYVFHARGTDVEIEGLEFGPPAKGSLAGEEFEWGDRQDSGGDMAGVVGKDYWNPPPGNGYGFLMHPRTAKPNGKVWAATWTIDKENEARLRLSMLPTADTQVVRCDAPGIYPKFPKAGYVMARRSGENLSSTFASIIEPYGASRAIKTITPLQSPDAGGVAVRIELANGRIDEITWSPEGDFRLARSDGGGTTAGSDGATGIIEEIDYEKGILFVRPTRPLEGDLAGRFVHVTNPAYAQDSPYRIAAVAPSDGGLTAIRLAPTRLILGRAHMDDAPADGKTLPNLVPIEYAKSLKHKYSGFFRGKRLETPDGRSSTRIQAIDDQGLSITVESSDGFRAGDDLLIYDVSVGDGIRIPL